MSNSFDFELKAGDEASGAIARIDEAVGKLLPVLDKTKQSLNLGGRETEERLDSLSGRLFNMSRTARDNVQFIGDMVPPLKMVGELAGRLGSIGVAGAAVYGLKQVADSYKETAREAYNLDVASKNAGMRVDDFTRLTGAMRILGADSDKAGSSVEGLFKTFNDAAAGNNSGVLAVMAQIGAQIIKNKNGTVDVLKTTQELARIFPTLRPEMQKTVSDALGLTPETLALLREGNRLKELLAKSDKFGLTVDPELNRQMVETNRQMNEFSARLDGLMKQSRQHLYNTVHNEPVTQTLNDAQKYDGKTLYHGDRDKDIRWAAFRDDEFKKTLSFKERTALTVNAPDKGLQDKLNARYGAIWQGYQLMDDLNNIRRPGSAAVENGPVPYNQPSNNAIGLRNNNPGNLRSAPNTVGKNGGFSRFPSEGDGLSAMARQLMLFGDRGNNTLNGIIHTYAPATENKTQAYIDDVAKRTGYKPRDRLNLHDPATLVPLMAAMVRHENGTQPFSREQLGDGVSNAIFDDRWAGLRNTNILSQQRNNGAEEISGAIKTALDESPLKLEVTMTDGRGGNPQTFNVQNGGRITYPMNH
ncbi:hypothetical protein RJE46_10840 [Cedecea neteri]|uniref:hypothetical protein n=1 Tax=Cedecea neteri TaxID=158822 RepID=UPI002892E2D7|nr:hypothetical protein [Cedecea neteri]WNJ81692.1 hypothetical protein RJE46_10840 [Cedecea neteri]